LPQSFFISNYCILIYQSNFCRLPTRDETNIDSAKPEFALKSNDLSPRPAKNSEPDEDNLRVNGADNLNAFDSNQTVANEPLNFSTESQATEISPTSVPNSSQLLDTNTTTSEAHMTTSPEQGQAETMEFVSAESTIETALEDSALSSTLPPVIDAQESDLRDANSPSARAELNAVTPQESPEPKIESESIPATTTEEDTSAAMESSPSNLPVSPPTESGIENPIATPDQESMQIDIETQQVADSSIDLNDTPMADVAEAPSTKIAREREDDDEIEPSAKRTKTEKSGTQPLNGDSSSAVNGKQPSSEPITQHEVKEIVKLLKNASRTQNGKNFRGAVADLWPNFAEAYSQRIKNPIDLGTMEKKLKDGKYQNIAAFKADLHLLYHNSLTFNGDEHIVTVAAKEVRDSLIIKVDNLPAPVVNTPAVKKDKKAKRPTPVVDAPPRVPAPRRQSKGSHPAPTPSFTAPSQTFALDPATSTPLIRRDSTKGDGGRPKREIHPPKSKDLMYSVRPKNKKFATELRFCEEVLSELLKAKHHNISGPFLQPVDPVALGIPNYFAVIKKPMDLSTIQKKLKEGAYGNAADFEKDVRQMFKNCVLFNPSGNPVRVMGDQFQDVFNSQWAKKDQWILDHTPAAASPASAPESDDDEDEEDEDEEEAAENPEKSTVAIAKERLLEEQKKLITLMTAKHRDPSLIQMQQDLVEIVTKRVQTEEENAKKKPKKAKASKPAPKKLAPPKRPNPPPKKVKAPKTLTLVQKETISAGLFSLPDEVTNTVLEMIQADQPQIAVS
jgi:bromodomain-containing factor 1